MTKAKKTLSVLLAVLMVLGTCLFSAFAVAPAENTYNATLTVTPNVPTAKAGNTVTFTVALTTDYKASTASAIVQYDTNVFETPVVAPSEDLFGAFPATEGAEYVKLPAGQAGAFVVDKSNKEPAVLKDAKLFDVTLTVKANAPAGDTTVSIVNDLKKENYEGSLYCGRYDEATNKVVTYGQTFNLTPAKVSIQGGAVEQAELALKPNAQAGLLIDTNITFGQTFAGVVYGFVGTNFKKDTHIVNNLEASAGGSLKITAGKINDKTQRPMAYSTNTTIEVLNADGSSTGKVYVVVIFGDANCDGMFNTADNAAVKAGNAPNASPLRMAMNVQKHNAAPIMHTINTADYAAEKQHVAKKAIIDQTAYAAHHSTQALAQGAKQSKYV